MEELLLHNKGERVSYSKTNWSAAVPMTVANLQKMEGQYSLILEDLAAHVLAGHPLLYRPRADMDDYFWCADNDGSGSTLDADTISGFHASEISGGVPAGFMGWWDPRNGAVPTGWLFCDGSSGTYDMRLHFPVGASGTVAAGTEVGNSQITPEGSITVGACTLTVANIHHTHNIYDYYSAAQGIVYTNGSRNIYPCYSSTTASATTGYSGGGGSHDHPGTFEGQATALDPVYQYLVIIEKS